MSFNITSCDTRLPYNDSKSRCTSPVANFFGIDNYFLINSYLNLSVSFMKDNTKAMYFVHLIYNTVKNVMQSINTKLIIAIVFGLNGKKRFLLPVLNYFFHLIFDNNYSGQFFPLNILQTKYMIISQHCWNVGLYFALYLAFFLCFIITWLLIIIYSHILVVTSQCLEVCHSSKPLIVLI